MFKKIFLYSFFHCADKGIMWFFPLFFLYFFNSQSLYAQIELIISYLALLILLTELGVRNYVIYSYNSIKFEAFNKSISILLYEIILLAFISLFICLFFNTFLLVAIIFFRLIYFSLYLFLLKYFRWIEKPIIPISINCIFHLCTILIIGIFFFQNSFIYSNEVINEHVITLLTLCYIGGFIVLLFIIKEKFLVRKDKLKDHFINGLKFSAPTIIVGLSTQMLPHVTKLITFETNTEVMIEFSLLLRYCLIIQIFHGIFYNYFTKTIYSDLKDQFPTKILIAYLIGLLFSSVFVLLGLTFFTQINFFTILIGVFYICVWCIGSSLELFFGRVGKNNYILFGGLSSILVYLLLTYLFVYKDINTYLFILLFSSLIYLLILILVLIIRRKIFFISNKN